MENSITLRLNFSTLKRIQKVFPNYPKEAAVDYFARLAIYLEKNQKEVKNGR